MAVETPDSTDNEPPDLRAEFPYTNGFYVIFEDESDSLGYIVHINGDKNPLNKTEIFDEIVRYEREHPEYANSLKKKLEDEDHKSSIMYDGAPLNPSRLAFIVLKRIIGERRRYRILLRARRKAESILLEKLKRVDL